MKFKKTIPYNLKRLIPILGLSAATMFTACSKEDDLHDVELTFSIDKSIEYGTIERHAKDPSVRTIYLVPIEDWQRGHSGNINYLREKFLQPRLDISPKVWGRGNFNFTPGMADKADSLWFLQHGWTINKYLQNQK